MIRKPTEKQIGLAKRLGVSFKDKTFRVLSAEISDELDRRSNEHIKKQQFKPGDVVKYIGHRDDMPRILVISSYGKNCYLYFKGIHSYCRPWDVAHLSEEELSQLIADQNTGTDS